jgi:two-component system cell cycle response regulator
VAKGLDLGANDYLMRPLDANELLARTRTQLRQKRHYERMRKNYEENFMMALIDPLTGAFNRRYLNAHLPRLLARVVPSEKPISTLMIDIDHFKQINDRYGHATGDGVLREVVNRITNALRPSDLVVRMGGEEFAVILPEIDLAYAVVVGERVRERIAKTPVLTTDTGEAVSVTISIGAACVAEGHAETAESLIKRADAALYKAKQSGRNCLVSG